MSNNEFYSNGGGLGLLLFLAVTTPFCFGANVTYDHRALVIDGKRRVLVSGSIHYPRSNPDMWPDLIQKSKDGGLDVIETYVFWNLHEPVRGQYDFEGRKDLVKFVKLVKEAGLLVHLRIGPYVCAEWNYGGFPLWLHFIPGIVLRTDNEPFKIENEYGNIDSAYGNSAKTYINWAAAMATSLDTGVPWVMCQQSDAPNPIYHGGTNFGRSTGGPFITTSYDYDAPIDEYGLLRQPKWGHLKDVHKAIKLCEEAMVATDPKTTSLGSNLEATVYKTGSGKCAAFLANVGTQSDATVKFNGNSYNLPAWSVSILPDCKNVVLNTAKINSVSTITKFVRQPSEDDTTATDAFVSGWSWINEPVGISSESAFTKPGLLEQINTTADQSDYLWYSLSIEMKGDEPFLEDGSQTVLHVDSLGHVLYAFINGKLAGSGKGGSSNSKVSIDVPISLQPGKNKIDLLSLTVGLAIGLQGEELGLASGASSLWTTEPNLPKNQPLVWYKTTFDAPSGSSPLALDFTGLGKGQAWINGQSIGRYWPTNVAGNSGCTGSCNYRGSYSSSKCLKNCGKPSQQLYHVPRSWLNPSGNILVLFEEMGGNPTQLSFATRETQSICSRISENHPLPVDMWTSDDETRKIAGPTLSLACPLANQVISEIKFASFGTPRGTCGSFSHGRCSSKMAHSVVEKACIGSRSCSIGVSVSTFGDPCAGITKSLAVEASCT
ncbi:UNVERIFIED_CONTAM: Beta-galactosidase 8 [Sesamum angustifolium]|uniref:beta-galactosidase n=1 Tax=Sesamum angustifolium TaxID=2727405 RepID=A0AAW2QPJ1_9LAMI